MRNEGHANDWLTRAHSDKDSALFLYEKMQPKPLEVICYLCQQASEKALKSLLFVSEQPLEKSHDLTQIAERLAKDFEISDDLLKACAILTPYATDSRYPTKLEINDERVKKVIDYMNFIVDWVNKTITRIKSTESKEGAD